MKPLLTLFFFLCFLMVNGQDQTRDVVYLKNGSIIKGSIISMDPASGIKIRTADGSVFVYKMEEIQKTEKEEVEAKQGAVKKSSSSSVGQFELENAFKPYLSKHKPELKFLGVSKTDGIKRTFFGQDIYEIEYELLVEATEDLYISPGNTNSEITDQGDFLTDMAYSKEPGGEKRLLEKGKRVLYTGAIGFEKTDNGWRNGDFVFETYQIVASDYLTPEMKKKQAEEKAKAMAEMKKKLDWQQADIASVDFMSKYVKTANMPVFGDTYATYAMNKSADYQGRKDVLRDIQEAFFPALFSVNRHTETEASAFENAQNKEVFSMSIQNAAFNFVETGYQCKIVVKCAVVGTYIEPKNLPFSYELTIPGSSSSSSKDMSKKQALASAIDDLKRNVATVVLRYKPISLELQRVVTDKKGKADQLVFKKPEPFISVGRIKFLVMHQDDIYVDSNGSTSVKNSIGECVFKGEINGDEIICEIRGGKNKKAFIQYVGKTEGLIGVSMY